MGASINERFLSMCFDPKGLRNIPIFFVGYCWLCLHQEPRHPPAKETMDAWTPSTKSINLYQVSNASNKQRQCQLWGLDATLLVTWVILSIYVCWPKTKTMKSKSHPLFIDWYYIMSSYHHLDYLTCLNLPLTCVHLVFARNGELGMSQRSLLRRQAALTTKCQLRSRGSQRRGRRVMLV